MTNPSLVTAPRVVERRDCPNIVSQFVRNIAYIVIGQSEHEGTRVWRCRLNCQTQFPKDLSRQRHNVDVANPHGLDPRLPLRTQDHSYTPPLGHENILVPLGTTYKTVQMVYNPILLRLFVKR